MSGDSAHRPVVGAPAVGDVIAHKYRVESVVGRGGMGVVLSARHVQLGQVVAIKLLTLPPDEDRRDEAIARFLHEAQAAAKLKTTTWCASTTSGRSTTALPYMVMELLERRRSRQRARRSAARCLEAEAVDYVLQACDARRRSARSGHRAPRPEALEPVRHAARTACRSSRCSTSASRRRLPTRRRHRSPTSTQHAHVDRARRCTCRPSRCATRKRVDARADIWALGIILYELLTGAPAFRGESFPGVCAAIVADPPMPVRTMRPDVSEKLEAIIGRCLEKDVQRRYQSVAELATELAPLGSRATTSGSGPQALVYSSHARLNAAKAATGRSVSVSHVDEQTVAMPSGPDPTRSGPNRTLESARLHAAGATQTSLASPDSRIEVLHTPRPHDREPRGARWLLPLGGVALLLGGGLWLRSHSESAAPATSADTRASSAPSVTADAPFTLLIDSEPPGATVSEGSVRLGTTPFSLSLSLAEGASPRAFVIEKDGYQPYVVRQGAARGQVRVVAALTAQPAAPVTSSMTPTAPLPTVRVKAVKTPVPAPRHPLPPAPKPPSDIRLER